jgi:NAD(P)-dependent dehydrogenase (short-subunit alcohol dehydrogenase family)
LTKTIGSERKVIVVTGATGGVGRGIALACAEAGWSVWIAARREKEGQAVAAEVDALGGEGHFVACDVGVPGSAAEAIATILSQEGRLDGVVHNATSGLSPVPVSLAEVGLADFQDHVHVALGALHSLARASFEALKESQGSLLLMTSEAGFEGKAKLSPGIHACHGARLRTRSGDGGSCARSKPAATTRRRDRGYWPRSPLPALRRRELCHRAHADGRRRELSGGLAPNASRQMPKE